MTFPTNVSALLADDVREEKSKKISLIGVFVGDDVVFPANTQTPLLLPQLCFFWRAKDGDGTWMLDWVVTHQNGSVIAKCDEPFQVTKLADKSLAGALRIAPFGLPAYGKFKLHLTLDDHPYDFEFEARSED